MAASKKKKPEPEWWCALSWLTGNITAPTALEFYSNLLSSKRARKALQKQFDDLDKSIREYDKFLKRNNP